MPEKKTVVQCYDSYGGDWQVPVEEWPLKWEGIKRHLGAMVFYDNMTVTANGGEESGNYSIREEGEPFVQSMQWETKEIEVFSYEEKEQMFLEECLAEMLEDEDNGR